MPNRRKPGRGELHRSLTLIMNCCIRPVLTWMTIAGPISSVRGVHKERPVRRPMEPLCLARRLNRAIRFVSLSRSDHPRRTAPIAFLRKR